MAVKLTETAAKEIAKIIKQQGLDPEKIHLRVGVKGGGCSGFSYLLDLTEACRETDEVNEVSYSWSDDDAGGEESISLKVICDPKSYLYLSGTTVDFKDELMGRGFVFDNPNASATCGCGSSFSA